MSLTTAQRAPYRAALAQRQAELLSGDVSLSKSHSDIGGRSMVTLNLYLRDFAGGRCVVCRQGTTVDTIARVLTTATVAVLIPCSMVDASNERRGYVAGNVASVCRCCVNMSNANETATGEVHMWTADTLDAELVPLSFPRLPKTVAILSAVEQAHATEARRVWVARGIV